MSEIPVPQQESNRRNRTALSVSVLLIAIASFLFSLWAVFIGFHNSIFDFHGFRQAQTAITAEYMQHGGPFLRYETPIAGPPWSIPFEFPLYQKIVALISEHLGAPLQETGRAVSIAFFYLCFFPLASILRRLRYTPVQVLAVLSLIAASPLYIFVSRMFMIESTALFLSIMYVDQVFRAISPENHWQYRYMISAAFFGALAGMVKVTTFVPFLFLACGLIVWHGWTSRRRRRLTPLSALSVALLCAVVPVAFTFLWTKSADARKAENPIGVLLTSKNLTQWNFGTLAQRLHPANYAVFLHRVPGQAGSLPLLLIIIVIYALAVRRWNVPALVSLALYIVTPMIFFNVHVVHEYYPYANAIFLLLGVGFLIAALLSLPGRRGWIGFACLVALLATCVDRYHHGFYLIQQPNASGPADVAAAIDRTTNSGDVIVISGLGISTELPYKSNRRAIMDPWGPASLIGPVALSIQNQHADTIPEFVACDDMRRSGRGQILLDLLAIHPSTILHVDNCDIYPRSATPSAP